MNLPQEFGRMFAVRASHHAACVGMRASHQAACVGMLLKREGVVGSSAEMTAATSARHLRSGARPSTRSQALELSCGFETRACSPCFEKRRISVCAHGSCETEGLSTHDFLSVQIAL